MINRGWEYRRKLLARLDPRFRDITRRRDHGPAVRRMRTIRCSRTTARSLPASARRGWTWCAIRRIAAATPRIPAQADGRRSQHLARRHDRARHRPHARRRSSAKRSRRRPAAAMMRTFMRRQLAGSRRLPHFVDVPVAHKTGDSGNIANDVGIIYSRSGPIVIAVMVTGITGSLGEAEDRIGRLAQLIVNHFDKAHAARRRRRARKRADSAAELQADAVAADAGDSDRRHLVSVGQHRRRSRHRPAREGRLRAGDAADHVERADRARRKPA